MRTKACILLIIFSILAIYSNCFQNSFVWDDQFLIVENPAIMSWNYAWIHFALDLYHSFSNYYRPIQMISYMIDFSIWRLNPFGYHLANVLLHISVSISLFMLLQLMTRDSRVAFIGALFYAVHPAHTAVVTYIAGRADSLALLFLLLSLIFWHWHFKSQKNKTALFFYIGSLIMFLLALLSKETAVIFPVIILCYGLFYISDDEKEKSKSILKFHYLSWFIIIAGVYIILRSHALNFQDGIFLESKYSLYIRLLTSLKAMGIYFGIIFLPFQLHMERSIPYVNSFFETGVLLSGLLFLFFAWLAVRVKKISKGAYFGFIFFLVSLLPVMNIYPLANNLAEHWLYAPMIGISIFLSCLGVKLWDERKGSRPILIAFALFFLLLFSYKTYERNFDWRDEYTIYTHTYNYSPNSIKVLNNLANLYHRRGNIETAMIFHRKAIKENPREYKTIMNLGRDYEALGMFEKALALYGSSITLRPDYAKAHFNMGNLYTKMGYMNKAASAYKKTIEFDEFNIGARINLGNIYFEEGSYEKARGEYAKAVEINPYLPKAHNNLGNALTKLGFYNEAVKAYKSAIGLTLEENAEYYFNLGAAYGMLSRYDDAIEELKHAYRLRPRDAGTLTNLGAAYYYKGDAELARREWQKALIVDPQNTAAKQYLSLKK